MLKCICIALRKRTQGVHRSWKLSGGLPVCAVVDINERSEALLCALPRDCNALRRCRRRRRLLPNDDRRNDCVVNARRDCGSSLRLAASVSNVHWSIERFAQCTYHGDYLKQTRREHTIKGGIGRRVVHEQHAHQQRIERFERVMRCLQRM